MRRVGFRLTRLRTGWVRIIGCGLTRLGLARRGRVRFGEVGCGF